MNLNPQLLMAYTPDQVASLVRAADEAAFANATDNAARNAVKSAQVLLLQWGRVREPMEWSQQWVRHFNNREFGFELFPMQDLDLINYNIYSADRQGEYGWHVDARQGPTDIKLTAVINVSTEEFEGGEFEVFLNGPKPIPALRQPGAMVVFPGFLVHRVTPVTRGTRRTISYWVLGPAFR